MKIQKVEISAFRAFCKEDDSTFDFALQNGDPADFISIYAPNGFGKTSFYDAVEWCITNKVKRFSRLSTQNEKDIQDIKRQNNEKNEFFLVNKDVEDDQKIFVKVSTNLDFPKNIFTREIEDRKFKYDFKAKSENKYFEAVILAQDTINSFLKEEKPEERYNRFVESFPQLNKSNEVLQNLRSLINVANEKMKDLETQKVDIIKKLEQLNIQEDNKIISEINETIKRLNQQGEELEIIKKEIFSSDDLDKLSVKMSNRILSISLEIERIDKAITNIDNAYNGGSQTGESLGVIEYFNIKNKHNEVEIELTKRKNQKKKSSLEKELQNNSFETKELNVAKDELEKIIKKFKSYDETRKNIATQIENVKRILKEKIKETEEDISSKDNRIDFLDVELSKYDDYKHKLNKNAEIVKEHEFSEEFLNTLLQIIKEKQTKELKEKELEEVRNDIDIQTSLETELKAFFSKGLELISKPEFSNQCPLCTQIYSSKEELSNKILKNDLLSKPLKILLNKKAELDNTISNSTKLIQSKTTEILDNIEKKYAPLKFEKERASSDSQKLKETKNEIIKHIKTLENNDISSVITNTEIEKLSEVTKLMRNNNQNSSLEPHLKNSITQIDKYVSNLDYQMLKKYFVDNNLSLTISSVELKDLLEEIQSKLEILTDRKIEVRNELESLQNIITGEDTPGNNEEQILKLEAIAEGNYRKISNFDQLINTDFQVDIKNLSINEVNQKFSELKEVQKKLSESKNSILRDYKIIENLKEDSSKLLEFETNKNALSGNTSEINKLEIVQRKLEEEKNSLESFLQKKIHSFFYHTLINQIYQKIEPHPDYNSIEFYCDFKDKFSPRLQIFSVDKAGKKSIPSLYFSSAQINILSLSVFLAKALNATDENGDTISCIFIDDPIQSMDSINILSFIDLFRSLVVNFDKQIIISTHEENFHDLLKKKIPVDLFKSKFIEFDSFGKVKQ